MKWNLTCWFIVLLSFFRLSLSAQNDNSLSEYQLLKMDMAAANTFHSGILFGMSCGNDYMLKELMHAHADGLLIYDRHAFMLQLSHNGYSRYGDLFAAFSYGVKFAGKFAAGLRFYYIYQHVAHYESRHSLCFDLSLYAKPTPKLSFGIEVYNPARLKYGITGKTLIPMRFTVMAVYKFSKKLLLSMKILKFLPGLFDLSLSCYYQAVNFVNALLSLSLHEADFGLMFIYRRFLFTIDMKYNYSLGFAPEVGFWVKLRTGR